MIPQLESKLEPARAYAQVPATERPSPTLTENVRSVLRSNCILLAQRLDQGPNEDLELRQLRQMTPERRWQKRLRFAALADAVAGVICKEYLIICQDSAALRPGDLPPRSRALDWSFALVQLLCAGYAKNGILLARSPVNEDDVRQALQATASERHAPPGTATPATAAAAAQDADPASQSVPTVLDVLLTEEMLRRDSASVMQYIYAENMEVCLDLTSTRLESLVYTLAVLVHPSSVDRKTSTKVSDASLKLAASILGLLSSMVVCKKIALPHYQATVMHLMLSNAGRHQDLSSGGLWPHVLEASSGKPEFKVAGVYVILFFIYIQIYNSPYTHAHTHTPAILRAIYVPIGATHAIIRLHTYYGRKYAYTYTYVAAPYFTHATLSYTHHYIYICINICAKFSHSRTTIQIH